MTWTLNASGHVDSKDDEATVIATFREAAQTSGAVTAAIATQHHGAVNLLDEQSVQREQQ